MAGSPSRVIPVGVRDDGAIYRHPWVDVEIAWLAVEAAVSGSEKVWHSPGNWQDLRLQRSLFDISCYNTYH